MPEAPKMLVPFDGSAGAERVLRQACRAARAEEAELTVLCVVALPADGTRVLRRALSELEDSVMGALARAQEVCREEGVVAILELSYAHDLGREIVEDAERSGATLICLSLGEHQGDETALMSPTVQSVLAAAPCSVLLDDPAAGLPIIDGSAKRGR